MGRVISDCIQRSDEWHQLRSGKLTASVAHVITMTGRAKGSESATRRDLRTQLALERITGTNCEREFTATDTERGKELEAEALAAYEARTGVLLSRVGFVYRDDLPIGCSPDGAVVASHRVFADEAGTVYGPAPDGFDGGVDVKAPRPANHLAYLREPSKLVADYEAQIAHTLLVTGAPWWDLASYCPQFPAESRLLMVRLVPMGSAPFDSGAATSAQVIDLAAHELNVRLFLKEVDAEAADIRRLCEAA